MASGRAVIPANINHPEIEPMIIGRNFKIKVNVTLKFSFIFVIHDEVKNLHGLQDGEYDGLSTGKNIHETREWIVRNSPVQLEPFQFIKLLKK